MTAMGGPTGPEVVVVGAVGINTNVSCAEQIDLSRQGYFTNNNDNVGQAGGLQHSWIRPAGSAHGIRGSCRE
jgi:hypothetical protein